METLEEVLNKRIDETLLRIEKDYEPSASDYFNIMRWARKGLLQRKEDYGQV